MKQKLLQILLMIVMFRSHGMMSDACKISGPCSPKSDAQNTRIPSSLIFHGQITVGRGGSAVGRGGSAVGRGGSAAVGGESVVEKGKSAVVSPYQPLAQKLHGDNSSDAHARAVQAFMARKAEEARKAKAEEEAHKAAEEARKAKEEVACKAAAEEARKAAEASKAEEEALLRDYLQRCAREQAEVAQAEAVEDAELRVQNEDRRRRAGRALHAQVLTGGRNQIYEVTRLNQSVHNGPPIQ